MGPSPVAILERLQSERRDRTDDALVAELRALEKLPPERTPPWDDEENDAWARAYLLVALTGLIAERGLVDAVPDVLAKMCLGDPGEMMRGMRHDIEALFRENPARHAQVLRDASRSDHDGARYWAFEWLPMIAGDDCIEELFVALDDRCDDVAANACAGLVRLAASRGPRARIVEAMTQSAAADRLRVPARHALERIREYEVLERTTRRLAALEREGAPIASVRTIRRCGASRTSACPVAWASLAHTALDDVRRCATCEREVVFCASDAETLAHTAAGHCIARAEPDASEILRDVMMGQPEERALATARVERALSLRAREAGIREAIAKVPDDSSRPCPDCTYPVPAFRKTCYVCGLVIGRA